MRWPRWHLDSKGVDLVSHVGSLRWCHRAVECVPWQLQIWYGLSPSTTWRTEVRPGLRPPDGASLSFYLQRHSAGAPRASRWCEAWDPTVRVRSEICCVRSLFESYRPAPEPEGTERSPTYARPLYSTRELSESVRFASLTQILRGGMYKILEHTPRRGSTTRQPPEARDTSANLRLAQYGFTLNEGRGLVNALLLAWVLVPYKVWRSARTSHVAVCSQSGASRRRRAILTAVQKCDAPAYRLCWRAACSHAAAAGTRDAGVRRAGGRAVVRPDLREHQVHAQV